MPLKIWSFLLLIIPLLITTKCNDNEEELEFVEMPPDVLERIAECLDLQSHVYLSETCRYLRRSCSSSSCSLEELNSNDKCEFKISEQYCGLLHGNKLPGVSYSPLYDCTNLDDFGAENSAESENIFVNGNAFDRLTELTRLIARLESHLLELGGVPMEYDTYFGSGRDCHQLLCKSNSHVPFKYISPQFVRDRDFSLYELRYLSKIEAVQNSKYRQNGKRKIHGHTLDAIASSCQLPLVAGDLVNQNERIVNFFKILLDRRPKLRSQIVNKPGGRGWTVLFNFMIDFIFTSELPPSLRLQRLEKASKAFSIVDIADGRYILKKMGLHEEIYRGYISKDTDMNSKNSRKFIDKNLELSIWKEIYEFGLSRCIPFDIKHMLVNPGNAYTDNYPVEHANEDSESGKHHIYGWDILIGEIEASKSAFLLNNSVNNQLMTYRYSRSFILRLIFLDTQYRNQFLRQLSETVLNSFWGHFKFLSFGLTVLKPAGYFSRRALSPVISRCLGSRVASSALATAGAYTNGVLLLCGAGSTCLNILNFILSSTNTERRRIIDRQVEIQSQKIKNYLH